MELEYRSVGPSLRQKVPSGAQDEKRAKNPKNALKHGPEVPVGRIRDE
jgi:hypothetical protein